MNKREIGRRLEEFVAQQIEVIESNCRPTKNSGASTEIQDILSSFFAVQCKVDNNHSNIIIKKKDWEKLFKDLPINSKRLPIFVNQQKEGIITITLSVQDFFRLIYKCYKATNEI